MRARYVRKNRYSADAVEEFSQQAMRVIQATNQIVDPVTGKERDDLRTAAYKKHAELKAYASTDRRVALYYASECDFLAQTYALFIHPEQEERLRTISVQLRNSVNQNNTQAMQMGIERARQEINNLPDDMQRILACRDAAYKAARVSPPRASAINDGKEMMVAALRRLDRTEADRIWTELLPEVQYWLYQQLQTATIETRLTK